MVKVEKDGRKTVNSYSKEIAFLLPRAEILSLYTLAKKSGTTNIFTRAKGEGNLSMKLVVDNLILKKNLSSEEKEQFSVNVSGNTLATGLLYQDGILVDSQSMLFFFENIKEETTPLFAQQQSPQPTETKREPLPTAQVIYEAKPTIPPTFWMLTLPLLIATTIYIIIKNSNRFITKD